MVTRRKERKFGIWINTDYRQFLKVPTYLALFSNRPFEAIASPEVERRHGPERPAPQGRLIKRRLGWGESP